MLSFSPLTNRHHRHTHTHIHLNVYLYVSYIYKFFHLNANGSSLSMHFVWIVIGGRWFTFLIVSTFSFILSFFVVVYHLFSFKLLLLFYRTMLQRRRLIDVGEQGNKITYWYILEIKNCKGNRRDKDEFLFEKENKKILMNFRMKERKKSTACQNSGRNSAVMTHTDLQHWQLSDVHFYLSFYFTFSSSHPFWLHDRIILVCEHGYIWRTRPVYNP